MARLVLLCVYIVLIWCITSQTICITNVTGNALTINGEYYLINNYNGYPAYNQTRNECNALQWFIYYDNVTNNGYVISNESGSTFYSVCQRNNISECNGHWYTDIDNTGLKVDIEILDGECPSINCDSLDIESTSNMDTPCVGLMTYDSKNKYISSEYQFVWNKNHQKWMCLNKSGNVDCNSGINLGEQESIGWINDINIYESVNISWSTGDSLSIKCNRNINSIPQQTNNNTTTQTNDTTTTGSDVGTVTPTNADAGAMLYIKINGSIIGIKLVTFIVVLSLGCITNCICIASIIICIVSYKKHRKRLSNNESNISQNIFSQQKKTSKSTINIVANTYPKTDDPHNNRGTISTTHNTDVNLAVAEPLPEPLPGQAPSMIMVQSHEYDDDDDDDALYVTTKVTKNGPPKTDHNLASIVKQANSLPPSMMPPNHNISQNNKNVGEPSLYQTNIATAYV